eukprot:1474507-Prymnesium_polylepis.1
MEQKKGAESKYVPMWPERLRPGHQHVQLLQEGGHGRVVGMGGCPREACWSDPRHPSFRVCLHLGAARV